MIALILSLTLMLAPACVHVGGYAPGEDVASAVRADLVTIWGQPFWARPTPEDPWAGPIALPGQYDPTVPGARAEAERILRILRATYIATLLENGWEVSEVKP